MDSRVQKRIQNSLKTEKLKNRSEISKLQLDDAANSSNWQIYPDGKNFMAKSV